LIGNLLATVGVATAVTGIDNFISIIQVVLIAARKHD
jgi:hypothetical protein